MPCSLPAIECVITIMTKNVKISNVAVRHVHFIKYQLCYFIVNPYFALNLQKFPYHIITCKLVLLYCRRLLNNKLQVLLPEDLYSYLRCPNHAAKHSLLGEGKTNNPCSYITPSTLRKNSPPPHFYCVCCFHCT